MITRLFISLLSGLICWRAAAQTADDLVSQGRSYLAAKDLADANTAFAQALAINPTNANANAFYAITRLLALPNQPAGSNFLTRIGLPVTGRDIYHWASLPPTDSCGKLLAPAGVNANEFTAQLRTNILPDVAGALGNLAVITDTNYSVHLTCAETSATAVTVDYGDLKMIQAGLYGAEYLIYTLNSQNLDAQLTDIRSLYTSGALSAGQVLSAYPQLLTFATTNDLQSARIAFTNAVTSYMAASAFIRARPACVVRLFNYDQVSAPGEADFRCTLQDLENSLAGAQTVSIQTNLTVDLATQFTGQTPWRNLLPKFDGNAIELGSLPDLTFGGLIDGLTREKVETALSTYVVMLPVGGTPELIGSNMVKLSFTTLNNHSYALESSTDLESWSVVGNFTATNALSTVMDAPTSSACFYRVKDISGFQIYAGVVLDNNTGLPIAGAQVSSLVDGVATYTGASGQFYLVTTLEASSWLNADILEINAAGYIFGISGYYYYGNNPLLGLQLYLSPNP